MAHRVWKFTKRVTLKSIALINSTKKLFLEVANIEIDQKVATLNTIGMFT